MSEQKKSPQAAEKEIKDQKESAELKSFDDRIKELEEKLKSAEAGKLRAEEKAVESVCKVLGVTPAALEEIEKNKEREGEILEYDIGRIIVTINGTNYTGRGKGPRIMVEGILSMAGNKRMRELRAKIGNNNEIFLLAGGGFSSRIVGRSEESLEG